MAFGVIRDAVWFHIFRYRFIDIPLAELGITHPGPVPDQLVCERPTNTSDQEVPDGMFQNRPVTYFEYMADVSTVSTRPRLGETHVANTASNLNKRLARHFRVGLPRYAMIIQKPIDFCLMAFLATHQIDFGVPEDPHRINRIHSTCFLENRFNQRQKLLFTNQGSEHRLLCQFSLRFDRSGVKGYSCK